jgi:4-amino-4-deoxy-L-arabinose transferase-like glycosyltransferase
MDWDERRVPATYSRHSNRLLLLLILAVAAALRVWGLHFGLPNIVTRPDENTIIGAAARFTINGTIDPDFFNYPTLYLYVVGALYAAACTAAVAVGRSATVHACAAAWPIDWTPLFVTARAVTAFAGVASVAAVVAIGRRFDRLAGPIAGLLLACAFLHVRDSHFAVTDVPMTTMVLVSLVLLLRAHERPSPARFAWAGLLGGLAAATKYNGVLIVAAALVSQSVAWRDRSDVSRVRQTRLLWFVGAAFVGFAIGTPYAVIAPGRVWRDASSEAVHLLAVHGGIQLGVGWVYHATVTLPNGVGWCLFVMGAAGVVLALARRTAAAWIVFAFPLIYYAVAGRGYTVFTRYMTPVVPFICLGAGVLIASAARAVAGRRRSIGWAVAGVLVAACAIPTAVKSVQFDRVIARTDSRVLATNWLSQRIPPGASILLVCSSYGKPQLWERGAALPYQVMTWEQHSAEIIAGERPDVVVVEESGLRYYSVVPAALGGVLADYTLQHVIVGSNPRRPHVYDQQDAFYLPIDTFSGVVRPGPTFRIFVKEGVRLSSTP